MISLFLTGNIGADAQQATTRSGKVVVSFNVGVSVGYGDNKRTEWVKCVMFGKRAESGLVQYLTKGQKVLVQGEPKATAWVKDGEARGMIEVFVQEVELIGSRDSAPQQAPQQQQTPRGFPQAQAPQQSQGGYDNFDDDVPF